MPQKKIICLGHISADIFINRKTLDYLKVGGCIQSQDLVLYAGGDAANVAYWLGLHHIPTSMVGIIAKDHLGEFLKNELEKVDINCLFKYSKKYPTSSILIVVEPNGERSFIINGRSQDDLEWQDLPLNDIYSSRLFYTSAYTVENNPIKSTVVRLFKDIKTEKKSISPEIMFNLASYTTVERCNKDIKSKILPYTDILVGNKDEFIVLVSDLSDNALSNIGDGLLNQYPNLKLILITDGENGSYYISKKINGHIPALNISVLDTTGAGDGFCAGFIKEYVSGKSIEDSVKFGNYLGSNICQGYGARFNNF